MFGRGAHFTAGERPRRRAGKTEPSSRRNEAAGPLETGEFPGILDALNLSDKQKTQIRHVLRVLGFAAATILLLSADRAHGQFGGDYVRYSAYGGGPYGYGWRGYYKAATPEPHYDVRARDDAGDPRPVYHGSLPMSATESYTRTSARIPEYYPTGRGVYGP